MHDEQYGFTKGRSTTLAGIRLIKSEAWEGSQVALGMFCDLSKVFDSEKLLKAIYS